MNSLDDVAKLCDPAYEIEGCYLWPADEAMARVGAQARRYESQRNGHGPLAWDHHWLMVPLVHADGRIGGWVWPDDPSDHLLPTPAKLRILRTFANQALAAVSDAAHVDQLQGAGPARRPHRRAQPAGLLRAARPRAAAGPPQQHAPSPLVMYDLDQFKALNDGHGHPAGDAALRSFTRILERNVRASDAVGRVGGDEFALILVGADAGDAAAHPRPASPPPSRTDPPALGEVRASYGTARAPDDGWHARRAGRGGRPPPLRPQAPAPRRSPAHRARRGRVSYT